LNGCFRAARMSASGPFAVVEDALAGDPEVTSLRLAPLDS
jgi:hypothetical protein